MSSNPKVGFVSLGCPKALVDSERILTQLRTDGYDVVPDYESADLVVVNTCGFIDSAVAESMDAIGEALDENGRVKIFKPAIRRCWRLPDHRPLRKWSGQYTPIYRIHPATIRLSIWYRLRASN